jgi:parallel beta-helix repeat protein
MVASLCLLGATAVAGDADFGDTVTDDVKLTGNISGSGDGLTIGASGITIDLNGKTISSTDGTGVGIHNPDGYDDITIKNGTIDGFAGGIRSDGGDDISIEGVTVDGASGPGASTAAIHILHGEDVVIEDCEMTVETVWLGAHGIRLDSVENASVEDCEIHGSFVGISFFSVTQFDDPTTGKIEDCDIEDCFIGVLLANTDDAEVKGCHIEDADDLGRGPLAPQGIRVGFSVVDVSNILVQENVCTNTGVGVAVVGAFVFDTEIKDNECNDGNRGILCVRMYDSVVEGNECDGNDLFGMAFNNCDDNEILDNQCNKNGDSGLLLLNGSDGNLVEGNVCNNNDLYGIALYQAQPWFNDNVDNTIEGNTAKGNGLYDCFHDEGSSPNYWDDNDCKTSSGSDIDG